MAFPNKKTSELQNKSIPSNSDLFRYANDENITFEQLKTAILNGQNESIVVSCAADNSVGLTLGEDNIYTIEIEINRGTSYRKEILTYINDLIKSNGYVTTPDGEGITLGITYQTYTAFGFKLLIVFVDDSSIDGAQITYKVSKL